MKNPFLACLYSVLLPGSGQLYLGEKPKGISILCITIGAPVAALVTTLVTDHSLAKFFSWTTLLFLALVYFFIMIPSVVDAFQTASGRPRTFKGESVPYILIMLFVVVGPFAIPLLWQSEKFSKRAKILLTAAVILTAFFAIAVMKLSVSFMDQWTKQAGGGLAF